MTLPHGQSRSRLVNGILDAQVAAYLKYKLTPQNLQGLLDRVRNHFLPMYLLDGDALAGSLLNVLLPLFQK